METVFHKILAGEIPNYTVYEDEHVLAFLDIEPKSKGHTLVIPKVFALTLIDLPDEALAGYLTGIKRTIERIDAVLAPDGFSVGWNMGKSAGQLVPYIHCHIMPRWDGDGGGNMHSIVNSFDGDVSDIAALFVS
jgi:histidine triad (HIT) family protein